MRPVVLLRLTCLAETNAFAALRLLPMSDWDKDAEILALCHQVRSDLRDDWADLVYPAKYARGASRNFAWCVVPFREQRPCTSRGVS